MVAIITARNKEYLGRSTTGMARPAASQHGANRHDIQPDRKTPTTCNVVTAGKTSYPRRRLMIALNLSILAVLLALLPAVLMLRNLRLYRVPADTLPPTARPTVSLLIPARNEAAGIRRTLTAALASKGVDLEVIVLDDRSEDGTGELVEQMAGTLPADAPARLRLERAPELPTGWCGKQHACWALAGLATHDTLVFLDADVRLRPEGLRHAVAFLGQSDAALVSGVPWQETGTLLEKLLIPLIHFILLGFLPMSRMRRSRHPAYGAGCGQMMIAQRDAYLQAGGHRAIRETLHDGVRLPRAFRAAGLATDLFDATPLADCRMYRSAGEVWNGLAKNAVEGLAAPRTILPATLLLAGGQVMPFVLLAWAVSSGLWGGAGDMASGVASNAGGLLAPAGPASSSVSGLHIAAWLAGIGCLLAWLPRAVAAVRFRQSALGALLHPVGVSLFLAIQWYALVRWLAGRPVGWRGRAYGGGQSPPRDGAGGEG